MRKWIDLCEDAGKLTLYHLTDNPHFALDPEFAPQDNAFAIQDRSGNKGIYLAKDIEPWVNGHNYWRPFVAEVEVDPSALEHDTLGRWSGEIFIPASQFDKVHVTRVMPIDAYAREVFGEHGWMEEANGYEFDTGKEIPTQWSGSPFRGYRYDGDTRNMPPEEIERLKQHFAVGHQWKMSQR